MKVEFCIHSTLQFSVGHFEDIYIFMYEGNNLKIKNNDDQFHICIFLHLK